jgi:L-seryl-tRNA(Ser) seleniumtransferase
VYRAAAAPAEELERRGAAILRAAGDGVSGEVVASEAAFGGGTSPAKLFASRALSVAAAGLTPDQIAARLRGGTPPVVARVERDRVLLDLRSILAEEDALVSSALGALA